MGDDLVGILNEGANESTMVARVLRHVEDRPVCPRAEDFYATLKYDDQVVVRLRGDMPGETRLPIDCRYRNGAVEFCHEHRDIEIIGRDNFLEDVQDAVDVEVLHHRESQFPSDDGDEDGSATKTIVADGGREQCVVCAHQYDRSEHDHCPNCQNSGLDEFATDGGTLARTDGGTEQFDHPVEIDDAHQVTESVDYSGNRFQCAVADAYMHTGAWPTWSFCPFCGGDL